MPKYLTQCIQKNNMYTDTVTIHSYITYKYYKEKCQDSYANSDLFSFLHIKKLKNCCYSWLWLFRIYSFNDSLKIEFKWIYNKFYKAKYINKYR